MLKANPRKECKVNEIAELENGIQINTENGKMRIIACDANIIRVVYTMEDEFSDKKSLAVINNSFDCRWSYFQNQESITFKTDALSLEINKGNCAFTYRNSNGDLLAKEPRNGGKTLDLFDVYMPVVDDETKTRKVMTPDGEKTQIIGSNTMLAKKAYHTKLEFEFGENEAIYGLGQHEEGILNLRGTSQYLYQANLKTPMPFILSTNGYGVFVDTSSSMIFHDDMHGSFLYAETEEEMDFYFINGENFDKIISGYRKLTGKAPMLPKWAFGYMQSRERYETQDETLEIAKEFKKREIPIDLLIMDWKSWGEGLWGQKEFDKTRFPNPEEMTKQLHNMGINYMISIWPNIDEKSSNYQELLENNLLLKGTPVYNPFMQKAREIYWKQANEGYFKHGVDAWWCDSSEPFSPDWEHKTKFPPESAYARSMESFKKIGDDEYINAYPFMHAMGVYEGQRATTDEKRVVNLTRSVYSGQQRFSTIIWSGDISANWDTLKNQICAGLNLCICGIPYWTLDIGAFFVKRGSTWFWNGDYEETSNDLGYRELYTRWFQFGAFLPIFRSHGTDTPREPWFFGDVGDMFYDTIIKFDKLRYKLIPYIYSLGAMVTFSDYTIMRNLAFDFASDINVHNIKDQYMFGSAFMVCPVTDAMYYDKNNTKICASQKSRNVYLPKQRKWYDFWTNKCYDGGQTIVSEAPIDIMPLFIPSGSIIPMSHNEAENTGEISNDIIDIYIYCGNDGHFCLYQDEGNNYNYEKGEYSMIDFVWDDTQRTFKIDDRKGYFKGMRDVIKFNLTIINDNGTIENTLMEYVGKSVEVKIL